MIQYESRFSKRSIRGSIKGKWDEVKIRGGQTRN